MLIDDRVEGLGISMLSNGLPINIQSLNTESASAQIVDGVEKIGLELVVMLMLELDCSQVTFG